LELGHLAGAGAHFGRTVYAFAPGRYDIVTEYKNEAVARFLLLVAMEYVEALLHDKVYPLEEKLAQARQIVADTALGPTTAAIVEAARRRGIPWVRLTDGNLVQLGHGVQRRLISAAQSDRTSTISVDIASDKELTKRLLRQACIPVPHGVVA